MKISPYAKCIGDDVPRVARVEGAQSACAKAAFFGPKHEDGSELGRLS